MASLNEAFNIIQPIKQPIKHQGRTNLDSWKEWDLKRLCKCGSKKREHDGSTSTNGFALSHAFVPTDGFSQLGSEYFSK